MTRWWQGALAATLLCVAVSEVRAQGGVALVKTLYAQANYEQALDVLADMQRSTPQAMSSEAHHYRALCLLALSRMAEAEVAMSAAVEADPTFVPSASDAPPRVIRLYADIRQRLLPLIVRRKLAEARERHQDGERQRAIDGFDAVLKLLADPVLATRTDLSDLRLAAEGLAELAHAQVPALVPLTGPATTPATTSTTTPMTASPVSQQAAAAPAAFPPANAQPPAVGSRAAARPPTPTGPDASARIAEAPATNGAAGPPQAGLPTEASDGSTQPVAILQTLPRWSPPDRVVARQAFSGSIYVSVSALGAVTGARMVRPVFPSYDALLLQAARNWRFRPATRNGVPVDGGLVIEIQLRPQTD